MNPINTNLDLLIAHPLKHHVFPLGSAFARTGLRVKLAVPFARQGFGELISKIPGRIGAKAKGYTYPNLPLDILHAPLQWKLRRMISELSNRDEFVSQFDQYIANKILSGEFRPKCFVSLHAHMPLSVRAANRIGSKIWSDQISNQSTNAIDRIQQHQLTEKIPQLAPVSEKFNGEILSLADIVTAPSQYTISGLQGRLKTGASVYSVPYGVDPQQFRPTTPANRATIRIIARANNIRKGGHLLLRALGECSKEILQLSSGKNIEIIFVGSFDQVIANLSKEIKLPSAISIKAEAIPHSRMPDLLASGDLFVMPALSESMSLICIEAMRAGLPSIITPYCGIDDFQDGTTGLLTFDSVSCLSTKLIEAFKSREKWTFWGSAASNAVAGLTWENYEDRISRIALEHFS